MKKYYYLSLLLMPLLFNAAKTIPYFCDIYYLPNTSLSSMWDYDPARSDQYISVGLRKAYGAVTWDYFVLLEVYSDATWLDILLGNVEVDICTGEAGFVLYSYCPSNFGLSNPFRVNDQGDVGSELCKRAHDWGDASNGYCWSGVGACPEPSDSLNCDKYLIASLNYLQEHDVDAIATSTFSFRKVVGQGCRLETCSQTVIDCTNPSDSNCYYGRVRGIYSNLYPARDENVKISLGNYLVSNTFSDVRLGSSTGNVIGEVADGGRAIKLNCHGNSAELAFTSGVGCEEDVLYERTFNVDGENIDFCFKLDCTTGEGWLGGGDESSCTEVCSDPDACDSGHCSSMTRDGYFKCVYGINCDDVEGEWDYQEYRTDKLIKPLQKGDGSQVCMYDLTCDAVSGLYYRRQPSTLKAEFDDDEYTFFCGDKCPQGTSYDSGLDACVCPITEYYDLETKSCTLDRIGGIDCERDEYYNPNKDVCAPIDLLMVDCLNKPYSYNPYEGLCLSRIDCVDCDTTEVGSFGHCSGRFENLLVSNGGWIGELVDCPAPGTVRDFGSYQICYYLPEGEPCSTTGCNVRQDYLYGPGWLCDPVKGVVVETPEMTRSDSSLELMPSVFSFGLQDMSEIEPRKFEDIISCSCAAQERALNPPFCPDYNPLDLPINCTCFPDERLFNSTYWNPSHNTFTLYENPWERCGRLGMGSNCYWKHDEKTFNLSEVTNRPGLHEYETWCSNALRGDYCRFTSSHAYQFNFVLTSLIDMLVFPYQEDNQIPVTMTYFTRGEELIYDDGLGNAVFKLSQDGDIKQEFSIEESIGALRNAGLNYAEASVFCYSPMTSEVTMSVNNEQVGVITCSNKPTWTSINFDLLRLKQGVNTVKLANSSADTFFSIDTNSNAYWGSEGVQCGVDNASPVSQTLVEEGVVKFFISDRLFIDNGGLYDLRSDAYLGFAGEQVRGVVSVENVYYVLTDSGLFAGEPGDYYLITEEAYNDIFQLSDELVLASDTGFRVIGGGELEREVSDFTVFEDGLFFKSSEGVYHWDLEDVFKVTSDNVELMDAVDWNQDGVADLLGYADDTISVWVQGADYYVKNKLLRISDVIELAGVDLDFNGRDELLFDNGTPQIIKLLTGSILNTSPVSVSGSSWGVVNKSLITIKDGELIKYSSPIASCPGSGGSLLMRLGYGEDAPVTVPDLLFPNINVVPKSVKVSSDVSLDSEDSSWTSFGELLYCMKPYKFSMDFVQEESDSWYDSFDISVRLGGTPLYCSGTKNIEYPEGAEYVSVDFNCQMPNCHWGLPRYESFRVCVTAGDIEYENCYSFDTIQGLVGLPDGVNGSPVKDSVFKGNPIKGYLWDDNDFYKQLSGFYLEDESGARHCFNNTFIPVKGTSTPVLLKDSCSLPETGSYKAYVYAGTYFNYYLGVLTFKPCTSDSDCSDDNICTTDSCDEGTCIFEIVNNGPYMGTHCLYGEEVECSSEADCDYLDGRAGNEYRDYLCINGFCDYSVVDADTSQSICENLNYDWFTSWTGDRGPCCGDDRGWDVFYRVDGGACYYCSNGISSSCSLSNYCEGNTRFYDGVCSASGCSFSSENCDLLDGYYGQSFRDYDCVGGSCIYDSVDPDTDVNICEELDYEWFPEVSGGTNNPCCGDDGGSDNFFYLVGDSCNYCGAGKTSFCLTRDYCDGVTRYYDGVCTGSGCSFSSEECDDGNPCTINECNDGACEFIDKRDGTYAGIHCKDGSIVECLENAHCDAYRVDGDICRYAPRCVSNECDYLSSCSLSGGFSCTALGCQR